MKTDLLTETTLDSQSLLRGNFLDVRRDTVRLPDGSHTTREYIVHPGAVMVIALLENGDVVLERQYRYPVGQVMVEFPAGKRDAGESAPACAQRELHEETGYRASEWARAGVIHPVISYSTECIEIWFARGLQAGERQLDAGEFLEVFTAPLADVLAWCANGLITDAKTVAGALWLQNVASGAWTLDWQSTADSVEPPSQLSKS